MFMKSFHKNIKTTDWLNKFEDSHAKASRPIRAENGSSTFLRPLREPQRSTAQSWIAFVCDHWKIGLIYVSLQNTREESENWKVHGKKEPFPTSFLMCVCVCVCMLFMGWIQKQYEMKIALFGL